MPSFPQAMPNRTDLAQAKKLLTEAGYPDGFSTTFAFSTGQAATAEPMAALVKEALGKVGIKVDIQKKPDAEFNTLESDKTMPFFTDAATAWLPYTYYFMYLYFTRDQRWNFSSFKSAEMEQLTLDARYQTDQAKYDADCVKMIDDFVAQTPLIMLWQPNQDAVMAQSLENYTYEFYRQVDFRVLTRALTRLDDQPFPALLPLPPGEGRGEGLPGGTTLTQALSRRERALIAAILTRVGRRLLASIPALFGVVLVTFILMRVLPGDPAVFFASGPSAGKAEIEQVRHSMGLDRPVPVQFALYMGQLAKGDLGHSMSTGQPVTTDMGRRLPASLELTFTALFIALIFAVPLGVLAALRPNRPIDHAVRMLCTLGVCVPTFVSGLLLIYAFYYLLGWAPDPTARIDIFASTPPDITGFYLIDFALSGDWEGWWAAFSQLILPACTMALFVLAPLARMTRASMLAVLGADFIRTASAMGLPRRRIIVTYALRNAILPVITITGIVFSTMLGANVLVEKVFSWPGVASYALDALLASDYAPVQAFVLLMALIFVAVNIIIDIMYGIADPRISTT